MQSKHLKLILIALALVVATSWGQDEEKIKLKDTPKAVQATIEKLIGKGKVTEVEKLTGDMVVYEVEIKEGDKEIEYIISEAGKVLKTKVDDDDDDEGDVDEEDDDEDEAQPEDGAELGDLIDDPIEI